MVASKIVALCALLVAAVSAQQEVDLNKRVAVEEFWKRDALAQFQAPEDTKAGSSCDAAFGAGYVTCREKTASAIRLCYNPSIGQVCCQNSWGCPSSSYCFTNNLCCPSGVDPATCAGHYSAGLPSNLNTADSGPAPTRPVSTSVYTTFTSTIVTSTPVATLSLNSSDAVSVADYATSSAWLSTCLTSSVSVLPVPLYTAGNFSTGLYPTATGTAPSYTPAKGPSTPVVTPSAVTSARPAYTGAASSNYQLNAMGGIAALLAIASLL